MAEDELFFVGLKAVIEKDREVLVLHDPEMGPDLPGGKIQIGETNLIEALKREVSEEIGLEIDVGKPFATWIFQIPITSHHRSAGKKIFSIAYHCNYLSGDIVLSPEHTEFHWVNKNNYREFTRTSNFQHVLDAFFQTE